MSGEIMHPLGSVVTWLRFLGGAAVVIVLPGYLVLGRFLTPMNRCDRLVPSAATGLLLAPLVASLLTWCRLPVTPLAHLLVVALLALVAQRIPAHRRYAEDLARIPVRQPWWVAAAALAASGAAAAVVFTGFADYVVPPTVHDAANHAFMTLRIAQTSSYDLQRIFGAPWGAPDVLYLPGWHVAAAHVARLGGLPPFVAAWMLACTALVLLPWAWTLLWNTWRLPAVVVAWGSWLVLANRDAPGGLLLWGGFGSMIGLALVPLVTLLVVQAVSRPSVTAALALGAGAAAMVHVHTASLAVALVTAAVAVGVRWHEVRPARWPWPAAGVLVGSLALFLGPGVWELAASYRAHRMRPPAPEGLPPRRGLEVALRLAGRPLAVRILAVAGCALALGRRAWRPLGVATVLLSALVYALMVWQDPISRALAMPFYSEAGRIRTMLALFAPVLAALALVPLSAWAARAGRLGLGVLALAVVTATPFLLRDGYWNSLRLFPRGDWLRNEAAMDDAGYGVARSLAAAAPAGARVANSFDDGTSWLVHLTDLAPLVPCGWPLTLDGEFLPDRVPGLLERPWPERTRELAARGVSHVFVSDRSHQRRTQDVEAFAADPRFEAVAREGDFAAFRIRWEDEDVAAAPAAPAAPSASPEPAPSAPPAQVPPAQAPAAEAAPAPEAALPTPRIAFGEGWGAVEPWGRWILATRATFSTVVPERASRLVLTLAPFPMQDRPQWGAIVADGDTLDLFMLEGTPWRWQRHAVELPDALRGHRVEFALVFENSWPIEGRDDVARVCPVQGFAWE